jgi:hypothetical protein
MLFANSPSTPWRPRGDLAVVMARGALVLLGGRGGNVANYTVSAVWCVHALREGHPHSSLAAAPAA